MVHGTEDERKFAAVVGRGGRAVGAVAFDHPSAFTNVCRPAVAAGTPLAELGS